MQVQVFIGNANNNQTSKLQEEQDRLIAMGKAAPVLQAGAYGEDGLLEILAVRAAGGQREILVDGCSRQQILNVLEWWSCNEDNTTFDGLVIHLARQD